MIYLEQQLQFLHFLQQIRSPIVDVLLRFLNLLDTWYFFGFIFIFTLLGFSRKWGIRLGFTVAINGLINALCKQAFELPRTFLFDSSLAVVQTARGFGFPSGGAQSSMLLGCLLIYFWKNKYAWPLGVFYIFLISFSRLFLGVHFPLDVLGGWITGLFLFVIYIKIAPSIERFAISRPQAALGISFGLFILSLQLLPLSMFRIVAFLMSFHLGVYLSSQYHLYQHPPKQLTFRIILGLFGVFSALAVMYFCAFLPISAFLLQIVQFSAAALYVSLFDIFGICKKFSMYKT